MRLIVLAQMVLLALAGCVSVYSPPPSDTGTTVVTPPPSSGVVVVPQP